MAHHQQLWSHVLLGQYSLTLQAPRKQMSWYSANNTWKATWFPLDHPSRPDRSSCWKITSLLLSTDILVCWIPCTLSSSPMFWLPLPLEALIVIRMAIRFSTITATHLLQEITSVYMFTALRPWGKWGPSSPLRDWVITCMMFPRSRIFIPLYMILDIKSSIPSFFVVLTASFKLVGTTVWFVTPLLWVESSAQWHVNNWATFGPFKEAKSSWISLSLITLISQLW